MTLESQSDDPSAAAVHVWQKTGLASVFTSTLLCSEKDKKKLIFLSRDDFNFLLRGGNVGFLLSHVELKICKARNPLTAQTSYEIISSFRKKYCFRGLCNGLFIQQSSYLRKLLTPMLMIISSNGYLTKPEATVEKIAHQT